GRIDRHLCRFHFRLAGEVMRRLLRAATLGVCLLAVTASARAATISIVVTDPAGQGFNDPTPVAPVGGNSGTTLGQQRPTFFQYAATLWGSILPDAITIKVDASFQPIVSNPPCSATSGVLGQTGVNSFYRDIPGLPIAGTYYVQALANKLIGADQNVAV